MGTHAKLSPSGRYRWKRCPGSVRELEKYPNVSGEAALDGTRTHLVLETCIKTGTIDVKCFIGSKMRNSDVEEFVIDAERASRVQIALDYIHKRVKELNSNSFHAETKISSMDQFGTDDLSGTVDVIIFSGDAQTVELIDYKDGINQVNAENNEQLELYALNLLGTLPKDHPVQFVRLTIIQPKLKVFGTSPIDVWDISVAELTARKNNVDAEVEAVNSHDAPLIPGEIQCKYCAHKGNCQPLIKQSMESLGLGSSFEDIAKGAANQDPETMSDERIREIIEAVPLIEAMIKGVKDEALKRLNNGDKIEGLKLVEGRGSRSWALDDEQIAEKLKKLGVPKDVIFETSVISIPKLEKAKWEKTVKGEKVQTGLSELQLKTLDKEYIKRSSGSVSVALASDKRPEVVVTKVEDLFSSVNVDTPKVSDFAGEPPSCTTTVTEASVAAQSIWGENPPSTPDLPSFFS